MINLRSFFCILLSFALQIESNAGTFFKGDTSYNVYSGHNGDLYRKFVFHSGEFTRTDSSKGNVNRVNGRFVIKNDIFILYRDSSEKILARFIFCDPHYDRNCVPERVWSLCSFPLYYERIVDMADMIDYTCSDEFPLCRKNKMIRFEWNDQYGKQEREMPVRLISQDRVPFVSVEYIMRNIDFISYAEIFVDTMHGTTSDLAAGHREADSLAVSAMLHYNSYGKMCMYDSLHRLVYISTYGPICNTCFDGFSYSISYNGNSGKPAEFSQGDYLRYKFFYDKNGSVERIECWNYTTLLSELRVGE